MKKRFKKMSFSQQIKSYYVLLFLGVFVLCGVLYFLTAARFLSASENNTLEYGLQTVENNMNSLMENINDYSKAIAFDDAVQDMLEQEGELSYQERVRVQESVIRMAACCEGISSIYLFDGKGESYIAGNIYEVEAVKAYLEETDMFSSALAETDFKTAVFSYETSRDENQQIISFVRLIRNLDTLKPMGILAMNVPVSRIVETFSGLSDQIGMETVILDGEGNPIASSGDGDWLRKMVSGEEMASGREGYRTGSHNGKMYKAGMMEGKNRAWTIVGAISRNETLQMVQQYALLSLGVVILGMGMCIFGASFITQRMTKPLRNILHSMEKVKEGKMERVPVVETNEEMDNLQVHYNQMLWETEKLMSQKVEEQRLRRKYELSLLQEQIKPHFLYNTFDSVCALAMMGNTKDVYTMMQALGQYYRNSLHKGQEIITVKEELRIVENYLIIQSFRYEDVFEAVYDVDESVKNVRMIKLILQPMVENAIYHGFRENELQGTITIRAKDDGEYVRLQVEDDGIGMEPEKLNQILRRTSENQGKRFGLYGTIQRINLYYRQEDKSLVDIQSEKGKGTVITVRIPKEMEEETC